MHYINNNNDDVIFSILPDTFAQKDADNCDYTPAFYVEIPDASGCISKSSVGSVNLVDTIAPSTPSITDVSVDANGNSVISWVPSSGSNHYLIYEVTDQGFLFIDSVHGEFSSTYTYLNSEADSRSETFNIKAIDSCSNSMSATLNHNSIYLSRELDERKGFSEYVRLALKPYHPMLNRCLWDGRIESAFWLTIDKEVLDIPGVYYSNTNAAATRATINQDPNNAFNGEYDAEILVPRKIAINYILNI